MFSVNEEEWPIGMPDIFIGKDLERAPPLRECLGFAQVKVIPPRDLLHPVLGQSINDKLLFHLCSTCAQESREGYCPHSDEERALEGTFFTAELNLAVQKGYRVVEMTELWNWRPERRTKDLFKDMIRDQYVKKAKASKFPSEPRKQQALLDEYMEVMGIQLRKEDFQENKALRALAKFSLNNLWGSSTCSQE